MELKTISAIDYCKFVTDGTHDSPKPKESGYRLITSKHLKRYDIDFDSANYISEEDYKKVIERSSVEQWDILFSMIGTIGNTYIETNNDINYACKNMGIFQMGRDEIKAKWLYYYLQTPKAKAYIEAVSRGTTQGYVPLGALRKMPIEITDDDNTKKIVSLLWELDEIIKGNIKINSNLEQQAQAVFKSWFVDFEPYGGIMPSDWNVVSFDTIVDFQNGYAFKSKELLDDADDNTYRVFKQGHINKGGGFNSSGTKSWYPISKCENLDKYILHKGDVLMAMTDMKDNVQILGNTAIMPVDNQYIVNQRVGLLRSKGLYGIEYPFIYLLTNNQEFLTDLRSRANSGVQVNLSSNEIKASEVVLATTDINIKFNDIVKPMLEKMLENSLENDKLAILRDTLLPKLMSGEIDLSSIDI